LSFGKHKLRVSFTFIDINIFKGDQMRKALTIGIALTLVLVLTGISFAQNEGYGNYNGLTGLGLKAGGIISNEVGSGARISSQNSSEKLKFKPGFIGGGFATYNFTELIAVQPEILFTMKGAKNSSTIGDANNFRALLNYVEIPVLLMVNPATSSNIHPEVYAGPAVSFLTSAKARADVNGQTTTADIKSQLHSTDFGVALGAGLNYMMGTGKLSLDARYTLGVTKIYKTTPQPNVRNSAISLMAGYSFR
jgi:hypothetical protein